jgi:hypothetical protein
VAALGALPVVENVSVSEFEPFGWSGRHNRFTHHGVSWELAFNYADGNFFDTVGVPILRGRTFTVAEVARGESVAMISDSVARVFFGDRDPVGQPLSAVPAGPGRRQEPATIVGVVGDASFDLPEAMASGAIYLPLRQGRTGSYTDDGFPVPPSLVVRTANPGVAAYAVEEALRRVDPLVRAEASLVRDRVDSRLASKQMIAWLVGPTAVIALLLAAFGVYGVTSFAMSQRQTEVSVRMAIGASSADILRLLVSDGLRPVMAGLVVGLALALVATRLSARMLEISGVSPNDPIAIGLAMSALMACALVAVIAPARRAARMDPASLLRQN